MPVFIDRSFNKELFFSQNRVKFSRKQNLFAIGKVIF